MRALGVVYGDIGTSPLYALRECFHGEHAIAPTPENIMGVLSMVFWSLVLVISGKYITFVLKADNQGEGGILALTALVTKVVVIAHSAAHVVHRVTVTIVRHVMVALVLVASSVAIVNSP